MLTTFEEIIEITLEHEGGYVHDPKDLGIFNLLKSFFNFELSLLIVLFSKSGSINSAINFSITLSSSIFVVFQSIS